MFYFSQNTKQNKTQLTVIHILYFKLTHTCIFQKIAGVKAFDRETGYSIIDESKITEVSPRSFDKNIKTACNSESSSDYVCLERTETATDDIKLNSTEETPAEYYILKKPPHDHNRGMLSIVAAPDTGKMRTEITKEGLFRNNNKEVSEYDVFRTTDMTYDVCNRSIGKFNLKQTTDEVEDMYHHLQPQNDGYSHVQTFREVVRN